MGKEEELQKRKDGLKKRRDGLEKQLKKMEDKQKTNDPLYSRLEDDFLLVKYELAQIKKSLKNYKPKKDAAVLQRENDNKDVKFVERFRNQFNPSSNQYVMPAEALQIENDIKQKGFVNRFRNQFYPLSSLTKEERNLMSLDEIRSINDATRTRNEDMQIEQFNKELEADKKKEEQLDELNKQFINGAVLHLTGVKVNAVKRAKQGKEFYKGTTDAWLNAQEKSSTFNNNRSLIKAKPNVIDDVSKEMNSPAIQFVSNTLQWGKNPFTMAAGIVEGFLTS